MRARAVLFDLDDTLHDKSATLRIVASCQFQEFSLADRGVPAVHWEAACVELNNLRIEKAEVFSRLGQRFALEEKLVGALLEHFDQTLGRHARPTDGARELIESCRSADLKIGVVTNGRDDFQRSKIIGMGFMPLIQAVVTSGAFGVKKPDHAIFRACLDALGVAAADTALVGDDFAADMRPAIELGMLPVWKSSETSPDVAFSSESLRSIHAFLLRED
jgi:putative hydrolase of the HAD superfamily